MSKKSEIKKTNQQKGEKVIVVKAAGKPLGRLAVEIAGILRGKNQPDFSPHKDSGYFVKVEEVEKIKITGGKLKKKIYFHHSGWPGGFKKETMEEVLEKKGAGELLRRAVWGMLPKNKLRRRQIKRLLIND